MGAGLRWASGSWAAAVTGAVPTAALGHGWKQPNSPDCARRIAGRIEGANSAGRAQTMCPGHGNYTLLLRRCTKSSTSPQRPRTECRWGIPLVGIAVFAALLSTPTTTADLGLRLNARNPPEGRLPEENGGRAGVVDCFESGRLYFVSCNPPKCIEHTYLQSHDVTPAGRDQSTSVHSLWTLCHPRDTCYPSRWSLRP